MGGTGGHVWAGPLPAECGCTARLGCEAPVRTGLASGVPQPSLRPTPSPAGWTEAWRPHWGQGTFISDLGCGGGSGSGGSVATRQHVQAPRTVAGAAHALASSELWPAPFSHHRAWHPGELAGGRPSAEWLQAQSASPVGLGGFLPVDLSSEGPEE